MYCPEMCMHLYPNEKEQTDKKEKHNCKKYKTTLYHGVHHPKIIAVQGCLYAEGFVASNPLLQSQSSSKVPNTS